MIGFAYLVILFLINMQLAAQQQQDLMAKDIVKKSDDNMRGKSSQADITIKIIRPMWHREMTMKAWSKGADYSMILVKSPAKEKGIVFLKRKKEVWNWIPSIERNIKLPPSMMSQSWMGTDFTNDDLVKEASAVDDYTHKLLGKESIKGKECYKIEMIPKPSAAIVWEKVIVWIDTLDFLELKAEFYDEDGFVVKTYLGSNVTEMGGRKIPSHWEMIPVDRPGEKTEFDYHEIKFNIDVDESFFSEQNMKRVR